MDEALSGEGAGASMALLFSVLGHVPFVHSTSWSSLQGSQACPCGNLWLLTGIPVVPRERNRICDGCWGGSMAQRDAALPMGMSCSCTLEPILLLRLRLLHEVGGC